MEGVARISVEEWLRGGARFAYRGLDVFTRKAGAREAAVLLLIHGFPTASWDWEALWPALAQRYRVLALDLLGFGFSAKPRRYDYSLVDQAELCEQFLRAEGVREYHVLAHDYGDSVAQELLARQTDPGERPRLQSVAFLNGGLFPEEHRPVLLQKLLLSPIGPLVARSASRHALASSLRRIFGPESQPGDELVDAFWTLMQHGEGASVMHRLIRYIPERRRRHERWVRAMQATSLPLKLIDGLLDPISGAHMVARYRQLIPNADVTELPRIGHYPQVEAPQAVLAAYLEFRERIGA
jgi:pimeloyl-ACP methyl ester carboxylesterase